MRETSSHHTFQCSTRRARQRIILLALVSFLCIQVPSPLAAQSKRTISGAGVYLFGPSITEADSVPTDESDALSDFANYSGKLATFIRSKGIYCGYVTARTIEVQYGSMRVFVVRRDSVDFGTIFTDGTKEPLLIPYVAIDSELKRKAEAFFGLQ